MKISDIINEGDVISFADKLASLSNPVKTSVPLIHRQRQAAKIRADKKLKDLDKKTERELSYLAGETQILPEEIYNFWMGYICQAFISDFNHPDVIIETLSKELLYWSLNDCKKFIELVKKENIWNNLKDKYSAGADFWYSRNGGAGCWDVDVPGDEYGNSEEKQEKRNTLYRLSEMFGPAKIIQKDDGKVYPKVSIRSILKKF